MKLFSRTCALGLLVLLVVFMSACREPIPTVNEPLPQSLITTSTGAPTIPGTEIPDNSATTPTAPVGEDTTTPTVSDTAPTLADTTPTAPSVTPSTSSTDAPTVSQQQNAMARPVGNAQIVKAYNDVTALVNSRRAGFKKNNITEKGNITGLDQLPSMVRSMAEKPMLEKVDEFLGVGTRVDTAVRGQASPYLVTASLREQDIESASVSESGDNYVLTIRVKGSRNPERNTSNPLGRYTADFRTAAEGKATLEAGMVIAFVNVKPTVESITINSNPSTITCTYNKFTGQAVNIRHQFSFNVEMLNIVSKAVGMTFTVDRATGTGSSDVRFTDFVF
ncbi:MAG: hypothetical protein FWG82_05835 [Oscillospiraceae bacterium]|nr:hypothetical protein [Oscillospiraceae bacterium]